MSCPTRLPARSPYELLRLHVVHLDLVDISMSEAVKLLPLTSRTDDAASATRCELRNPLKCFEMYIFLSLIRDAI
jgi:hypothetical protein